MASLRERADLKSGETRYVVQTFAATAGTRGGLRVQVSFGTDRKGAERAHEHIEQLEVARRHGQSAPTATTEWLAKLPGAIYGQLVKAQLAPERAAPQAPAPAQTWRLAAHIDDVIQWSESRVKERSLEAYEPTKAKLTEYFGTDKPIVEITPRHIEDWIDTLRTGDPARKWKPLSAASVALHGRNARRFFKLAVTWGRLTTSPFEGAEVQIGSVAGKKYEVPAEVALKVLAELPTPELRALFALARFGGLRVPSETHALTWDKVDFGARPGEGKLTVYAPKAHRKRGKTEETLLGSSRSTTALLPFSWRLSPPRRKESRG